MVTPLAPFYLDETQRCPASRTTSATRANCPSSGLVLRHTMPMVREGCGAGRRATETVAERVSIGTAISGMSVTPIPAPTICTSVDSELPSIILRATVPDRLQKDSA